jgi:predicted nucleic acid-binding protein
MLLDTSCLVCCFDADEYRHADAVRLYDVSAFRLTHNYVIAEFVALTQARRLPREQSLAFAAELLIDSQIEVVWIDEPLHRTAMQLLQAQRDKQYSLCDAVSIVLMQQRGIIDALSTDRHFEQAGFRRLLVS